jgi:hypothetical protein
MLQKDWYFKFAIIHNSAVGNYIFNGCPTEVLGHDEKAEDLVPAVAVIPEAEIGDPRFLNRQSLFLCSVGFCRYALWMKFDKHD